MLFDTDKVYEIKLRKGGKEKIHTLRQPNQEDIHEFEKKMITPLHVKGNEMSSENSTSAAYRFLWGLLVQKVEGYPTCKDWKEKVPGLDKIPVARVMGKVEVLDEESVIIDFGKEHISENTDVDPTVFLKAKQDGEEILCIHYFKVPTDSEIDEYSRISALSKTKRRRNKVIISPSPTVNLLCGLYDSLIRFPQGYKTEKDAPLSTEQIPPVHKLEAVKELFAVINEEIEGN